MKIYAHSWLKIKKMNLGDIRIDGSTPANKRTEYAETFQTDVNIRIAILSIGAAGTGIQQNSMLFSMLVVLLI
tara:strand:+ start:375 stop:593 length:219 start_codon:yes stop_codon:yes gene_type:complete